MFGDDSYRDKIIADTSKHLDMSNLGNQIKKAIHNQVFDPNQIEERSEDKQSELYSYNENHDVPESMNGGQIHRVSDVILKVKHETTDGNEMIQDESPASPAKLGSKEDIVPKQYLTLNAYQNQKRFYFEPEKDKDKPYNTKNISPKVYKDGKSKHINQLSFGVNPLTHKDAL